jgi:hypothetical protein
MYLAFFIRYFENRISNIVLYTILIFTGGIMAWYGIAKTGEDIKINILLNGSMDKHIVISHHADELYGMAAGYGLLDDGIIDGFDRIKSGIAFFFQMIVPASLFPNELRFPQIITSNTRVGGGGMVMFGAYFFWSYIGVCLFSLVFSFLTLRAYRSNSMLLIIWIFITLVFSFNWTSYDFHTILRWPFYACFFTLFYKGIKIKKYAAPKTT